jgi:hypothetical protein
VPAARGDLHKGVEQVDFKIALVELHHRASHRNAALLFDGHPVAGGMPGRFAGLDRTRHLAGITDQLRERQTSYGDWQNSDDKNTFEWNLAR